VGKPGDNGGVATSPLFSLDRKGNFKMQINAFHNIPTHQWNIRL
jgi:hypothetical protein